MRVRGTELRFEPYWFIYLILALFSLREFTPEFSLAYAFFSLPNLDKDIDLSLDTTPMKVENLELFGMSFKFDNESESFELVEKDSYTTEEILSNVNQVLESIESINSKGYVTTESFEDSSHFIKSIEVQLLVLGYEKKSLGESNNSYSL
jgi:hypothetical protein